MTSERELVGVTETKKRPAWPESDCSCHTCIGKRLAAAERRISELERQANGPPSTTIIESGNND